MSEESFDPERFNEIMAESSRLQNLKHELSAAILAYNGQAASLNLRFQEWSKQLGTHLQHLAPLEFPPTSTTSILTTPSTGSSVEMAPGSNHNDSSGYDESIPNEFFDPWDGTMDSSGLDSSTDALKSKPRGRRPGSKNATTTSKMTGAKYGLRSTGRKFTKTAANKKDNNDNADDVMNDE